MALTGQSGQFSSLLEGPRTPVHFAIKSGEVIKKAWLSKL